MKEQTTLEKYKLRILEFIAKYDGEYGWYRIARSIVNEKYLPVVHLLGKILDECEESKLIIKTDDNRLRITENGRQYLQKFSRRPQRETV